MGYFNAIILLARNDLKLALKDRSTILWLFIMPTVFFYFIGTVTQGGMSFVDTTVKLLVENNDGEFLSRHLEARLEENLFAIIRTEELPPAQEEEEPPAYCRLIIPSDFTEQLQADQQVSIFFTGLRSGFGNRYDFFRVQKAAYSVLGDLVVVKAGGCWWPIEVAPDWMQQLQMFTPTGWTMDALHKLISFGMPWKSALPHMAILIVATFLVGWAAAKRFRFV